jgi:hypothetical protein
MLAQNGGLMTAKPSRYFWIILLALLTACGQVPQSTEMDVGQSTALAIAQTSIALTQTAMPTSTPEATPIPTQPIVPLLTPDAIQVERWKEYQTELAKSLFSYISSKEILCEWDILQKSDQDVYVWVVCKSTFESSSTPAVIHLGVDGFIQNIEIPGPGLYDYPKMFPPDVQEKFT